MLFMAVVWYKLLQSEKDRAPGMGTERYLTIRDSIIVLMDQYVPFTIYISI